MRWLVALLVVSWAGCIDAGPEASDAVLDVPVLGLPPPRPADLVPAPHGAPRVEESATETEFDPLALGWVARRTTTITNGVGDLDAAQVLLGFDIGYMTGPSPRRNLAVVGADAASYTYTVVLEAHGSDEADARAALDAMDLHHEDRVQEGVLSLNTTVTAPPPEEFLLLVSSNGFSVDVHATLPRHLAYDLVAANSVGNVSVEGLSGPRLQATSSFDDVVVSATNFEDVALDARAGAVQLSGAMGRRLDARSDAGGLDLQGRFDEVSADTRGDLRAVLTATGQGDRPHGTYRCRGADVDVRIQRAPGQALNVSARSEEGTVDIRLSDGEGTATGHARSRGFETARWRTTVEVEAWGNATVAD